MHNGLGGIGALSSFLEYCLHKWRLQLGQVGEASLLTVEYYPRAQLFKSWAFLLFRLQRRVRS